LTDDGYAWTDLLPEDFDAASLREDVLRGLRATPKWLPPKWFYDKTGSALFEEITRLPEYYPTRTERSILLAHAAEIVTAAGARTLVELGSGSSEKTTALLDELPADGGYLALDVSESALRMACEGLARRYPTMTVAAVRADFGHQLAESLAAVPDGPRLLAFLGGTMGNLDPAQRVDFLAGVRSVLRPGDSFLLGADLVKPASVLVPAYDDAAGVTAAFNRNVLDVVNRRLRADFDVEAFRHVAVWNATDEWIEMRLRALSAQTVQVAELGLQVEFAAGEEMRTEISAKFTRARLEREFTAAGFAGLGWWTDEQDWFSLSLWT
jgi:L-histidine N-alpha-methyltransferase